MHFRVLGWLGFAFFAAGLLVLLFGPREWKSYGCGALLTAVTLYVAGFVLVAKQISRVRQQANDMLLRVAEEMERRKGGAKKVIDVEKADPREGEKLN